MNLKLTEILDKTRKVLVNYPLVLLMSLIMTVACIILVERDFRNTNFNFVMTKIICVSALGISLIFALNILSQRLQKSYIFELIGLLFLVGFYFILPKEDKDFTEMYLFVLAPAYLLSHLLVAFVAFVKNENSEKNFWQYNKNLFINFFLTLVFTGVLTGGVELAILAVDNLFDVNLNSDRYLETFYLFAIFGSTFIFLLFNESGLEALEKDGDYPVVLKFFTQFILIPLLIIYVVILYFYSIKILINWELPRGWVSYLILAYSVIGILALLLVHPLKENVAKSWVKVFSKAFYFTLIPLLVLLFVAIFTRILAYSFTEARYFVLLLAIWLTTVVAYFTLGKRDNIKFIPISLFLFGVFALTFPYFNAFSVGKRSQKNDLERILTTNQLLVDGKIDFKKSVVDSVANEIENKFDYLDSRHQRAYLVGLLKEEDQSIVPAEKYSYWSLASKFENIQNTGSINSSNSMLALTNSSKSINLDSYQFAIRQYDFQETPVKVGNDSFRLKNDNSNECTIVLNDKDSLDLIPAFEQLFDKHKGLSTDSKIEDLSVVVVLKNYQIKVTFQSIQKQKYSNEKPTYWMNDALFLIKKIEE